MTCAGNPCNLSALAAVDAALAAVDASTLHGELGWRASETFEGGLRGTLRWYLHNGQRVREVTRGAYRSWVNTQYGQ
ncbi:MAG: hypothetical protein IT532_03620 [Burkholderiales bacterium]|nr:hypothetical protein [Burkholderiales bacterium]